MKKLMLFLTIMLTGLFLFAQADPTTVPWWQNWELISIILGAALLIIEWVLRAIPTSKPVGFILQALVWIINKLLGTVNNRKKGGGFHK